MNRDIVSKLWTVSLVAVLGAYACAPVQISGGGTLGSGAGKGAQKVQFGLSGDNCTPGHITGTFNYHDKDAGGWAEGGLKLNGTVFEATRCAESNAFNMAGIACGLCNLQFCNCSGWPESVDTCVKEFVAAPGAVCAEMRPIPENVYGVGFQFRSTNPAYPGDGVGVACITDNGQGRKATGEDTVVLLITNGQYQGYVKEGAVRGNIAAEPCCHDLCVTGFPPVPTCDPCIEKVCAVDLQCCTTAWGSSCVVAAQDICGVVCDK